MTHFGELLLKSPANTEKE